MYDIDYSPQQATNVCLGVAYIKMVLETSWTTYKKKMRLILGSVFRSGLKKIYIKLRYISYWFYIDFSHLVFAKLLHVNKILFYSGELIRQINHKYWMFSYICLENSVEHIWRLNIMQLMWSKIQLT